MNILLVSDNFLPHLGGVERHVYTLLRYLVENGVTTTVVTSTKERAPEIDEKYNIKRIIDIKERSFALQWTYQHIQNSENVAKIINKIGPEYDLVHCHGPHQSRLMNVDPSIKLMSTKHGIGAVCIGFWGIEKWCEEKPDPLKCSLCVAKIRPYYYPLIPLMVAYTSRQYRGVLKNYERVNMNLAVSKYVYDVIYNTIKVDNMKVVYNFIDIENDIKYYLEQIDIKHDDDKKTLIFSGRLDEQKGIHLLLYSFEQLCKKYENLELIITGNGTRRELVEQYDRKYDNIRYEGYVSRLRQIELIANSDIFLAPSIYPDACPTTIMEALALGKPVIATTAGGIPEIAEDNVHGYLAVPGDGPDLTLKLEKMIQEDTGKYAEKCKKKSEFFDIKTIGPQIIKEYEKLIERS
jgi:glycosyltransferase involved in cell wall biosynthesis